MKRKTIQNKDYCEGWRLRKNRLCSRLTGNIWKKNIVDELSSYSKSSNYWNLPVQAPGLVITFSHNYP